ncbi:uncharacterized protein N0V89_010267 [Didymosphaeria variabile]|uniref:Uncharacterized protein n=1 Tax=Didymosphaeria variabile TaxID=1932322 RepID=A0A9W8XB89_9PLEO|nr:uncharacterized protein N0V89_010267 [Didymosphaeria variabile]KAJ4346338.1 hypothetical protein N0V89_010267 [Didymosphaeria variabile]
MSDTEMHNGTGKAKSAWTDKERLVYLLGVLESAGTKLDYKNAPRPNGRSEIACERMIGRIKTAYKAELEALKAGQPFGSESTPRKKPGRKAKGDNEGTPSTPKRKAKGAAEEGEDEDGGSPTKKGKKAADAEIKAEVKDELDDEMNLVE